MSRLLVSWIATTRDFLKNEQGAFGGINPLGPTANFHQHYFESERLEQHILLYSDARQENYATHLVAHLRHEYPGRAISAELLPLTDIIDLEVADAQHLNRILSALRAIDVVVQADRV